MNRTAIAAFTLFALSQLALGTQADTTTMKVTGQTAGPKPFISNLSLTCSDPSALKSIKFTIKRKTGTHARPLSASYPVGYLESRGYINSQTGAIKLPVFGLYDGYSNAVTLLYRFVDGSSKAAVVKIDTAAFNDACDFNTPNVLQARTTTTALSYDFFLVTSSCSKNSPTVLDSDGNVRWVGTANVQNSTAQSFDNAMYLAEGPRLLRIELDGAVRVVGDYSSAGVHDLHHNIDRGKVGLILDVNTPGWVESVNLEVDPFSGAILNKWNLAKIISTAMTAGGDDPSTFVLPAQGRYDLGAPEDWFHNNSVVYRGVDNSLIVSSRENFVIALDYNTKAIKWILGDPTKKWYQYPSLRKYAFTVPAGGLAPVGQHSLSLAKDKNLLLFDNGEPSKHKVPKGPLRYSAPRKYRLDLTAKTATEVWSFPNGHNIHAAFCSSVYEDAPNNYLVDYAQVGGSARILGLTAAGDKVFEYGYPTSACKDAFRSLPLHWEDIVFAAPPADVSEPGLAD